MAAMTTYIPVSDELDLMAELVPLNGARIVEAGCGAAHLARALVQRFAGADVLGLEVDERQLAANLAAPAVPGLLFAHAGAQAMPLADASVDGALMLKSLHHVPMDLMDAALAEMARVVKPGGWLYVSEPVYGGSFNEIVRLFNDEGVVRAAAQAAVDRALASGRWTAGPERRFSMPVRYASFAEFEARMMRPTFADHQLDDAKIARVKAAFDPHLGPDGAPFERLMHVRVLHRSA